MRFLMMTLIFCPLAWAQDAEEPVPEEKPEPVEAKPVEEKVEEGELLTATRLRERVRTMRKDVLVGGPAVVRSEKEALKFYRKKLNELARRADELRTNRDVKESEYDLALDTTLNAKDEAERQQAARQASVLRAEMAELDTEIALLDRQGEALGNGVMAIRKRMEQRKRLLTRFDRPDSYEELPYLSDGVLDLDGDDEAGGDPFVDEGFIEDLIRRDPHNARKVIYQYSVDIYWKKFPLTPPRSALKVLLKFPEPDLPGGR